MKTAYRIIFASILSISSVAQAEPSFNQQSGEVSNWQTEAATHLNVEQSVLAARKDIRCIKLNNYWCLKDVKWAGRVGKDSDSHTAFRDGYYSARAAVRNFRTAYSKHGLKSASALMSVYAPSDDCIGSKKAQKPDGSCIYGKNDPAQYARLAAKGITKDIDADLVLFDKNGNATSSLVIFLKNMSAFELGGLHVSESTISKGICLEDASCSL